MNKNIVSLGSKLALLGLASCLVFSSCSKKSNEPVAPVNPENPVTPTPPPTPPVNTTPTAGVGIKLKAGVTQITITAKGQGVKLGGQDLPDGEEKTLTFADGQELALEGAPTSLTITKGAFETLDLSKATPSLTELTTKVSIGNLKLDGATNLTKLDIDSFSPLKTLDLSKLSKLGTLYLGNSKYNNMNGTISEVTWPTENNIVLLNLDDSGYFGIDFTGFKKLEDLVIRGKSFNNTLKLQNHSTIKKVSIEKPQLLTTVIIENCPKLETISRIVHLRNTSKEIAEVNISNNPELTAFNNLITADNQEINLQSIKVNGNSKLTKIGYSQGYSSLSYFKNPNLKLIDITGTPFIGGVISFIVESLPAGAETTHTFKSGKNQLNNELKAKLQGKGWKLVEG